MTAWKDRQPYRRPVKVSTCKRGHVGAKRDSSGSCMQCQTERNRTPERRAAQRAFHKRYRQEKPRVIVPTAELRKRLFAGAETVPEAGCWLWTGSMYRAGYGQISIGAHRYATHRVSFTVHKG